MFTEYTHFDIAGDILCVCVKEKKWVDISVRFLF